MNMAYTDVRPLDYLYVMEFVFASNVQKANEIKNAQLQNNL